MRNRLNLRSRLDRLDRLDRDQVVNVLCDSILKRKDTASTGLLALYSIISSYDNIPTPITQRVQYTLQRFERDAQQSHSLTMEQRQLITVISRLMGLLPSPTVPQSPPPGTPDGRAIALYALKVQREPTVTQIEELLSACTDARTIPELKRAEVGNANTVQKAALDLLDKPFDLKQDVVAVLIRALADKDALVCAAAALLLLHGKLLLPETQKVVMRKEAAQKMMEILQDDELSRRPLDLLRDYEEWRLDDVLFETLKVLVE
jgi:hypothetical protein